MDDPTLPTPSLLVSPVVSQISSINWDCFLTARSTALGKTRTSGEKFNIIACHDVVSKKIYKTEQDENSRQDTTKCLELVISCLKCVYLLSMTWMDLHLAFPTCLRPPNIGGVFVFLKLLALENFHFLFLCPCSDFLLLWGDLYVVRP